MRRALMHPVRPSDRPGATSVEVLPRAVEPPGPALNPLPLPSLLPWPIFESPELEMGFTTTNKKRRPFGRLFLLSPKGLCQWRDVRQLK